MTRNDKTNSLRTLAALIIATASATTAIAHAATVTGDRQVNVIEYSNGTLLVQLDDAVNYYGVTAAPAGCTVNNRSIDTLKTWASMTQAALLSGKKVRIYWNECSGRKYIELIDLFR